MNKLISINIYHRYVIMLYYDHLTVISGKLPYGKKKTLAINKRTQSNKYNHSNFNIIFQHFYIFLCNLKFWIHFSKDAYIFFKFILKFKVNDIFQYHFSDLKRLFTDFLICIWRHVSIVLPVINSRLSRIIIFIT